jgi:hypothetical protein
MSKIGINGFGRIGRLVLRAAISKGAEVGYYTRNMFSGIRSFILFWLSLIIDFNLAGCRCERSLHFFGLHGVHVQI